jgi:GNAT superfamily N-acetyltransferase
MQLRRATANDLQSIFALHRASILELCTDHYTTDQLAEWTAVLRPDMYLALLSTHEVFVAEDMGSVLGFGVFDASAAFINATYVSPAAVRRGVGRGLMAAMEGSARHAGATQVRLNATLNAVPFYARLGYSQHGASVNRLPTGAELPCVAMQKDLTA